MQTTQLKNIIDRVRNRIRGDLFYTLSKEKKSAIKFLCIISVATVIPTIFFYAYDLLPIMIPWVGIGIANIYFGGQSIREILIKQKNLTTDNFTYIRDISGHLGFSTEKQKLSPDEVKTLLTLSFSKDYLDFLNRQIKTYGYLTHDNIYAIYSQILREINSEKRQVEIENEMNTNFYNFLKENGICEQKVVKNEQLEALESVLHQEELALYVKSFNSKSVL